MKSNASRWLKCRKLSPAGNVIQLLVATVSVAAVSNGAAISNALPATSLGFASSSTEDPPPVFWVHFAPRLALTGRLKSSVKMLTGDAVAGQISACGMAASAAGGCDICTAATASDTEVHSVVKPRFTQDCT